MPTAAEYRSAPHDPRDPSPWQALFLDQSLPLDPEVKAALLSSGSSRSRQWLLPIVRPIARLSIALLQIVKTLTPKSWSSSRLLHRTIHLGLRRFVRPDANWLILRHFHIGSEILQFIRDNVPGIEVDLCPLRPRTLADVEDDLFLNHDLNLFNFVIRLNQAMKEQQISLGPPARLDFSAITDGPFDIETMPSRWTNFVDLQTAIEIYTPIYQLLLTDSDFWRASHSLQLDETIAVYLAALLGDATHLSLVNNRHPLVPDSTLAAGWRLMLHGLSSETLHALLRRYKRAQAAGEPLRHWAHAPVAEG